MKKGFVYILPISLFLLFANIACTTSHTAAKMQYSQFISVDGIFGNHMVSQQQTPIIITGQGTPNSFISIDFGNIRQSVFPIDGDGHWRAILPPQTAGGPFTMKIAGDASCAPAVFEDIMIGEVWLCSGQSNMQWPLSMTVACDRTGGDCDGAQAIAEAENYPIRIFDAAKNAYFSPGLEQSQPHGKWELPQTSNIGGFSATAWYFARQLSQDMPGITIGLVNACYGGTKIVSWISETGYLNNNYANEAQKIAATRMSEPQLNDYNEQQKIQFKQQQRDWMERFANSPENTILSKDAQNYHKPELDDSDWPTVQSGRNIFPAGQDGICWLRKTITIPDEWIGTSLVLHLGIIDDCDWTYVNGNMIGSTLIDTDNYWETTREYEIPPQTTTSGNLTIAIKLADLFGDGGLQGETSDLYITSKSAPSLKIDISHDWKFHMEFIADTTNLGNRPKLELITTASFQDRNFPSTLYNSLIHPWLAYRFRGVLWSQGESNTAEASEYAKYLTCLIEDWRRAFSNPTLPFVVSQAAGYRQSAAELRGDEEAWKTDPPGKSFFAPLREAQYMAVKKQGPKLAAMAVAIDVADQYDPHPRRKSVVGYRLAKAAERLCYGNNQICSGPEMSSVELNDGTFIVHYDNVGSGLIADQSPDGTVGGFIVAGEDGIFHHASGIISDDTVIVTCQEVTTPKFLRYGWVNYSEALNLYNKEGFPAVPFRTDLPSIYQH